MLKEFFYGFKVPHKLYWDPEEEKILQVQEHLSSLRTDYWYDTTLNRWYWWFLIFWTIFPLWIWWKYTDRSRFLEVSSFGLLVGLCSGILDTTGVFLLFWSYPYKLLPFLPNFFPIDFIIIPIAFMLLYQKYTTWKQFLVASTVFSTVLSMLLDPILVWMNLYQPLSWQYYYSVPVFVFLVSFSKWVIQIIIKRDIRYEG